MFCIVIMLCMYCICKVILLCIFYLLYVLPCSYLDHYVSVIKFIVIISQPLTLRFVVFLLFFYIINVSDLGQCIVTNISAFNINETVPDLTKVVQQDNKQRRPFKTMHSSTGHK